MRTQKQSSGFAFLELLLIIVVVAGLVVVGLWVYQRQINLASSSSTQSATASEVSTAPTITTASDLDKAIATLDQNDPSVSNNDATTLNTQVSSF